MASSPWQLLLMVVTMVMVANWALSISSDIIDA
jgi:hypothetical protein